MFATSKFDWLDKAIFVYASIKKMLLYDERNLESLSCRLNLIFHLFFTTLLSNEGVGLDEEAEYDFWAMISFRLSAFHYTYDET